MNKNDIETTYIPQLASLLAVESFKGAWKGFLVLRRRPRLSDFSLSVPIIVSHPSFPHFYKYYLVNDYLPVTFSIASSNTTSEISENSVEPTLSATSHQMHHQSIHVLDLTLILIRIMT